MWSSWPRSPRGQAQALRELHQRHAPWLTVRLSHRLSDPALVDEAVQDTFVAVWRRAKQYRGE
ncbi:MAG: RNA polymerase sigma factor [Acidimicrobiia bacterium]